MLNKLHNDDIELARFDDGLQYTHPISSESWLSKGILTHKCSSKSLVNVNVVEPDILLWI